MTYVDALTAISSDPHAWRFRQLCSDENPDAEQREAYRVLVVRMATGDPEPEDQISRLNQSYAQHGTEPLTGGCCGG